MKGGEKQLLKVKTMKKTNDGGKCGVRVREVDD